MNDEHIHRPYSNDTLCGSVNVEIEDMLDMSHYFLSFILKNKFGEEKDWKSPIPVCGTCHVSFMYIINCINHNNY